MGTTTFDMTKIVNTLWDFCEDAMPTMLFTRQHGDVQTIYAKPEFIWDGALTFSTDLLCLGHDVKIINESIIIRSGESKFVAYGLNGIFYKNALVIGHEENESFRCKGGNNTIHSRGGVDEFDLQGGVNHIYSGAGNDFFKIRGGTNYIDGGSGNDQAVLPLDKASKNSISQLRNIEGLKIEGNGLKEDMIRFEKGDFDGNGTMDARLVVSWVDGRANREAVIDILDYYQDNFAGIGIMGSDPSTGSGFEVKIPADL